MSWEEFQYLAQHDWDQGADDDPDAEEAEPFFAVGIQQPLGRWLCWWLGFRSELLDPVLQGFVNHVVHVGADRPGRLAGLGQQVIEQALGIMFQSPIEDSFFSDGTNARRLHRPHDHRFNPLSRIRSSLTDGRSAR